MSMFPKSSYSTKLFREQKTSLGMYPKFISEKSNIPYYIKAKSQIA